MLLADLKKLITKTIIAYQTYKSKKIFTISDFNISIKALDSLFNQCLEIELAESTCNTKINNIINDLNVLFKSYGTNSLDDLIRLLYGDKFINLLYKDNKYELLANFVHPFNYSVSKIKKRRIEKHLSKLKIVDDNMIINNSKHLECYDLSRTKKDFELRVNGMKLVILNYEVKELLIIEVIVDDVCINNLDYLYLKDCNRMLNTTSVFLHNYIKILRLKDKFIYNSEEIVYKSEGIETYLKLLKSSSLAKITQDFITNDLFSQRSQIIKLLLDESVENQYTAYLLYDLLNSDNSEHLDSINQELLYNSLPWNIKLNFKSAMKHTIDYTNKIANFDFNKIPFEQKICLLKAPIEVKEKAMTKLKEIKSKPEDSGGKAKHYLEGLLKIPFGIFCKEPILNKIPNYLVTLNDSKYDIMPVADLNYLTKHLTAIKHNNINYIIEHIPTILSNLTKKNIIKIVKLIFEYNKKFDLNLKSIKLSSSQKILNNYICTFVQSYKSHDFFNEFLYAGEFESLDHNINDLIKELEIIKEETREYMSNVHDILDNSIYGHDSAKRQVERVIGQWLSGEPTGYTLGFEGPPGVGKTSLAKEGIAKCLVDSEGNSRPFSFIAIGGEPNSSTLVGHNYTYVGSNWGKLVDILMDKKIMNPIIFIDELDKISKTEQGKEIIGILTHIIDSTQNMHFQDRFFSGIDLDLSKALFIFSYNDVDCLDRILLDRIHRIKFKHLAIKEKIVIVKKYILPSVCKSVNLIDCIDISDDIIEYIIYTYTNESGVRKLKELIFEIVGEINLEIINQEIEKLVPIKLTKELIRDKYLKNYTAIIINSINSINKIGVINGLWANAMGNGGIIQIECMYYITSTLFDLKLTGRQGDVMKESMNVAKNLAWSLLNSEEQNNNREKYSESQLQGIHIHAPEGATPKDGPSAGTAITVALYSLFSNKPINHEIAITGEINLSGQITAIGGLDLKIIGGIRAGVKHFLFPNENLHDYNKFLTKYKGDKLLDGIRFNSVDNIHQVIDLIFD